MLLLMPNSKQLFYSFQKRYSKNWTKCTAETYNSFLYFGKAFLIADL